jgi:predicted Zn-dependent peptidase
MNNIKIKNTKSGLPVIILPQPLSRAVTVLIMIRTGSKYETHKTSGLSHFLEHMFFKGTEKYPQTASLSAVLDAVGADFNAFTSKEYTGYYIKVEKRHVELALDVLSQMLLHSKFDEKEIEQEKGVIIEELNMYEDNPLMKIEDVFESCIYGDTPAGWDTIGNKRTIGSFKRQDFISYMERQYGKDSSVMIVSGDVSVVKLDLIDKYFSEYRRSSWKDKVKTKEVQKIPRVKLSYKKMDQVVMSLGVRAFPSGHKYEAALRLLSVILGGSMSSRLFIKVRERQGLAYFIKTAYEAYTDTGYLATTAGIKLGKEKVAITSILGEYKDIAENGVTASELKKAKDLIKGKMALQLETSDELASWYGHQWILRDQIRTPEQAVKEISKVSAADIKAVARLIFKEECLNFAAIGPFKDNRTFVKILSLK